MFLVRWIPIVPVMPVSGLVRWIDLKKEYNNRVCKNIRNCFMETELYLQVTQHYKIRTRVPQCVILEAKIDLFCTPFHYESQMI